MCVENLKSVKNTLLFLQNVDYMYDYMFTIQIKLLIEKCLVVWLFV